MKSSDKMVSGELVFELYDTYGFPLDLTSLILSENNFHVDVETFHYEMNQQKKRSRQATKIETSDWNILFEDDKQEFIGYDTIETDIKISRFREVTTKDGNLFHLVFNLTPFFPKEEVRLEMLVVLQVKWNQLRL